jgi:hypothetical protein
VHNSIHHFLPARTFQLGIMLCLAVVLSGAVARAVVVTGPPFYQSGILGAVGQAGGSAISLQPPDQQWLGVRFQTSTGGLIDGVGGNLSVYNFFGNGLIFASLVKLSGLSDYPDSTDLSTPDVLATTTFTGAYPSVDVVVPIGPVAVGPGTYALIFGSGQFGATGQGAMATDNTPVGTQSEFELSNNTWSELNQTGLRFTVYAMPEPRTIPLLLLSATVMLMCTSLSLRRKR